jgi:hypothetical protein
VGVCCGDQDQTSCAGLGGSGCNFNATFRLNPTAT